MSRHAFRLYMPNGGEPIAPGGEAGIVVADGAAVTWFRGPGYSRWTDAAETVESGFYRLHAALEGWHATVLHVDDGAAWVRLTPDERRAAEALAARWGCSVSEAIRRAVAEAADEAETAEHRATCHDPTCCD